MNRLKLLAAVALLGIPLAACEEATPPPPVGSIAGTVSIEGTGIDGVSVSLSNGSTTTTAGGGAYRFDNVEGGAYTVSISGYPDDATFDATSAAATISSAGQSVAINFSGTYIRTASVTGSVTVEGKGIEGVTVRLSGVADATTTTGANGGYNFTALRKGAYTVEIDYQSDEIGFASTTNTVSLGVGDSRVVNFKGTYLRTAGVRGQVTIEGVGLEGVTVSLSGGPESVALTETTDASGQYAFMSQRGGDYRVGISGYDQDDYEFEVTSQNVTLALGQTATVSFDGVLLRTSGISGQVSVPGVGGLADVTVTLSMDGMDDMTYVTMDGGQYAFSGLGSGTYTVEIADWDAVAYDFATASVEVTLGDDDAQIHNFVGAHTKTASISGQLFLDADMNDMRDMGELAFAHAGLEFTLIDSNFLPVGAVDTGDDGSYSFEGLLAARYQVVPTGLAAVAPMLAAQGLAYGGNSLGETLTVEAGGNTTYDPPIDITHQTVTFTAMMGHGPDGDTPTTTTPVAGVGFDVYLSFEDANTGENAISGTTDSMGVAKIMFERSKNTDMHIVTMLDDESAPAGFEFTSDIGSEHQYGAASPTSSGGGVTLVNTMASATWMVRAHENELNMGMADPLPGRAATYTVGSDTVPMKGIKASGKDGMFSHTFMSDADDLGDGGVTYTVTVADGKTDEVTLVDGTGMFTHDGLNAPDDDPVDLGTFAARFTKQNLVTYVHWERDFVEGFSADIRGNSDERPATRTGDGKKGTGISVKLWEVDDNNRLQSIATRLPVPVSTKGIATFTGLDAEQKYAVEVVLDTNMQLADTEKSSALYDVFGSAASLAANGISGAFGELSGTTEDVMVCPLSTGDDCSTFAYIYTGNSVSGNAQSTDETDRSTGGRFTTGKVVHTVTVNLTAKPGVNVHKYSESVVLGYGEDGKTALPESAFDFPDVPEGVYELSVADTDVWDAPSKPIEIEVFRGSGGQTPDSDDDKNFTLLYKQTTIHGLVANDQGQNGSMGNGEVDDNEARAGVKVTLMRKASATAKTYTVPSGTAATTDSGTFVFKNVTEGTYKIVGAKGADYIVVPSVGTVTTAVAEGMRTVAGPETLVGYDYGMNAPKDTSSIAANQLIILRTDAEIKGSLKSWGNNSNAGVEITLRACAKQAVGEGFACGTWGNRRTTTTAADGTYSFTGVTEGYYQLSAVQPAGSTGLGFSGDTYDESNSGWVLAAIPGPSSPTDFYFDIVKTVGITIKNN